METEIEWIGPDRGTLQTEIKNLNYNYMTRWAYQAGKSMSFRNSRWPARSGTANKGPYSKQHSINKFYATHKRVSEDEVHISINNRARNRRGKHYARFVNRGVNQFGQVSRKRFAANYDAVGRTIKANEDAISDFADTEDDITPIRSTA